jgi:uncharacterized protein (UPF0216 family)
MHGTTAILLSNYKRCISAVPRTTHKPLLNSEGCILMSLDGTSHYFKRARLATPAINSMYVPAAAHIKTEN